MTIAEFKAHNKNNTMPCEWIGQGYGYKDTSKEWKDIDPDDIIYIPEHAYEKDEDGRIIISREDAYSKNDFKRIIYRLDYEWRDIGRCVEVNRIAKAIFEAVDWQFPESLANEMEEWA